MGELLVAFKVLVKFSFAYASLFDVYMNFHKRKASEKNLHDTKTLINYALQTFLFS